MLSTVDIAPFHRHLVEQDVLATDACWPATALAGIPQTNLSSLALIGPSTQPSTQVPFLAAS